MVSRNYSPFQVLVWGHWVERQKDPIPAKFRKIWGSPQTDLLIPSGKFDAAFDTVILEAWPFELIGFSAVALRLSESWSSAKLEQISVDHTREWTQLLIATPHHCWKRFTCLRRLAHVGSSSCSMHAWLGKGLWGLNLYILWNERPMCVSVDSMPSCGSNGLNPYGCWLEPSWLG